MRFYKIVVSFLATLIFFPGISLPSTGQNPGGNNSAFRIRNLREFSRNWGIWYSDQKYRADSIVNERGIPSSFYDSDGTFYFLRRFERDQPVYFLTHNLDAAKTVGISVLWDTPDAALTGDGIKPGLWDGSGILSGHDEFMQTGVSRVIQRDQAPAVYDHSTHVAGTIGAAGVEESSHGMAPLSIIVAYDMDYDIAEMASEAADGMVVSNHSYGTICGWKYNSADEYWYWYGDLSVSTDEDLNFGRYTKESYDLDWLSYNAPWYLIVKSAGNDRNDCPPEDVSHLDWVGYWMEADDYHPPDGGAEGYDCLGAMSVAKNIITVGSVDDFPQDYSSPDDIKLSIFSSCGPTDDGRIKPDLVANGTTVYSSIASSTDAYAVYSGTSMSAPSVTGLATLINEAQQKYQPGVNLYSSSVKALLIHSAYECGSDPGPDYQYGWGLLNGPGATELLYLNYTSGGEVLKESWLSDSEENIYRFTIPDGEAAFKATLCWTDPPGVISEYVLNDPSSKLINDLNLELVRMSDGAVFYPWVLNPLSPAEAAFRGVNHLDNVEQIFIESPASGEYELRISHFGELLSGSQTYSLIASGHEINSGIYPPTRLTGIPDDRKVLLRWTRPENEIPQYYNIYVNQNLFSVTTDTFFVDTNVINNETYSYHVTSIYEDDIYESLPSNTIDVMPLAPQDLPFTESFENELIGWNIRNDSTGWIWGDSESLSSYYLDFEKNSGNFIAVDSYSARGSHVWDMASTPPLNLERYNDVTVSFNYLLVTGIYDAIDEMNLLACFSDGSECVKLATLPASNDWTRMEVLLPTEVLKYNTKLVFYYDDMYQWGMGAGLDDVYIDGTLNPTTINNERSKEGLRISFFYESLGPVAVIQSEHNIAEACLQITTIQGQVVVNRHINVFADQIRREPLTGLSHGVYLLTLSNGFVSETIKFIVR